MINKDNFSVGVIGAGEIVSTVHLPVLLAMKEASIAWLADLNPDKANSVARAYHINHIELPKNPKDLPYSDIILLAIPYGARNPYYEALSDDSCALYVEKPFARTVDEHKRLCSLLPDYRLACGFQRRSWGPTLQMKQLIKKNLFGRLCSVRLGFGGPGIVTGGGYNSNIDLAGGGIIMETGCHSIDALFFILSANRAQVDDVNMIMDNGFDMHTNAKLCLTTSKQEQIKCEAIISCLQETINCLEFTFDHAIVSFSLFGDGIIHVKDLNSSQSYTLSPINKIYPLTAFQTFYSHWSLFFDGIRTKHANHTAAFQSILTTEVIEKLYSKGLR